MKKLSMLLAVVLCTAATPALFADRISDIKELDPNGNGHYDSAQPGVEYQNGPCVCYCKVTKFEPQEYCTTRCVQEPYCVEKKCTRQVPEYYTKTHCRYVPEYYTKTYCRYRTECYSVPETKYRTKTIVEKHCKYVPKTYIKRTCANVDACQPACAPAPAPSCASGACGR